MTDAPAPNETENSADAPAPAKRSKTLIFAAVAIVAGAVTGGLVLGPAMSPKSASATPAHDSSATSGDEHGASASGEHGAKGLEPHMLESIVLNPAGSRGTRFLLLTVGVQLKDQAAADELGKRDVEARDRVLQVFGTKTVDELVDVARRAEFRAEMIASLDSLIGKGKVRAVFFPQFVIQ
jgi:flagellar FliL protein